MTEITLNIPNTSDILKIAENAAREAGNYLTHYSGRAKTKHQKSPVCAFPDGLPLPFFRFLFFMSSPLSHGTCQTRRFIHEESA
jgi:hypothetical protein